MDPSEALRGADVGQPVSWAAMIAADRASTAAGIEVTAVRPGRATATMAVRDDMLNGHGIAHGGYVFMLADTTFAMACNSHGRLTVAAGCDITYLRPVRAGDMLVAEAVERIVAGRSGLYDVRVCDGDGRVVAEMRGRSTAVGRPVAPRPGGGG